MLRVDLRRGGHGLIKKMRSGKKSVNLIESVTGTASSTIRLTQNSIYFGNYCVKLKSLIFKWL